MDSENYQAPPGAIPPFVKWAGGKRWLLQRYPELLPSTFNYYLEPFVGSGATFFALAPEKSIISDKNEELIITYTAIRDAYPSVQLILGRHARNHSDEYYYRVRDMRPDTEEEIAARFLYLNRACWNGLYRVNLRGEFNVPRGTKNSIILPTDNFEAASKLLLRSNVLCNDFESTIDKAGSGDFIFVDPPYTTAHNLNGFVKYNDKIFTWQDQIRLKNAIVRASARGALILVTNADHVSVRELYAGVGSHLSLDRATVISGSAKGRGTTTELAVVVGYEVHNLLARRLGSDPWARHQAT